MESWVTGKATRAWKLLGDCTQKSRRRQHRCLRLWAAAWVSQKRPSQAWLYHLLCAGTEDICHDATPGGQPVEDGAAQLICPECGSQMHSPLPPQGATGSQALTP